MVVADATSPHAPAGHALVICVPASLDALSSELRTLGYDVNGVDNPFTAIVELLDRPLVYRSVVLSLPAVYREELSLIKTIRARLPHIDVLLAHTDGRASAMAEAMRLGATGLLGEDAVHRLSDVEPPPADPRTMDLRAVDLRAVVPSANPGAIPSALSGSLSAALPAAGPLVQHGTPATGSNAFDAELSDEDLNDLEPILTAEELRALLQEQPTLPPNG